MLPISTGPAIAFLLALIAGVSTAGAMAIDVTVDGSKPLQGSPKAIPHDAVEIRFLVKPPPGQVRYRLEGHDRDWQQRTGGMVFVVRFHNKRGDQIGQQIFPASGRSNGWKGALKISELTDRQEQAAAPPDADHITVAISSAGPSGAVGVFAVTNVHVFTKAKPGLPPRDLISDSIPTKWNKGGTRPSLASTVEGVDDAPLFVITDDDITGHADWTTSPDTSSGVSPGEILQIRWQEVFSIGMGDPLVAKYGRLTPGVYHFQVEELGLTGKPSGHLTELAVRVPLPFWKNPWYWAALAILTISAAAIWGRRLFRKKIRNHLRQVQLIADERLRIARDLHDDLGARLSHISLLGSHALTEPADIDPKQTFEQIISMSQELINSLSETVWMLNSKNDHLESLVNYLCRMVSELCGSLSIRCRIDAIAATEVIPISSDFRHNISMAVKESVNNALKHSRCTEIRLQVHLQQENLMISVEDNGIGLNAADSEQGDGLDNIRQRMHNLHGELVIGRSAEGGVSINLRIPL